ncbi:O-antigen ligase family protein [Rheinheimera metallidurans]|uniref:O-antigen ligase family protein n=1 Tax=Rheinheimera metallidurans TaxID=2925781 RepID=UPI003001C85A
MPIHFVSNWQRNSDALLLRIIPLFLLVDCVNGALLQYTGSSFALASIYKLLLLSLMTVSLVAQKPKLVSGLALLLVLLLIGPGLHWSALPMRWIQADLQLALKIISPLLAFAYLSALSQRMPEHCRLLCQRSLYFSALVLLVNILAGLAGLGFNAYQPLEGVAQSFLGIKGFFYSTNELSAVLLVLSAAVLALSWPQHKPRYLIISLLAVAAAALMLTKTGLFGVLVLVLFVPLLLQPAPFWQQKRLGLLAGAVVLALVLLLVWLNGEYLLRSLGIYDKLTFVYHQRGISGILLSSRDYYAGKIWQTTSQHYSEWQRYLGVGQGGVGLYLKKYFAELDWFDLLIFHGLPGLFAFLLTFSLFIRRSWQARASGMARCLILLNVLLLTVSSVVGHIMTSGMLWLPWALTAVLLLQPDKLGVSHHLRQQKESA